MFSLVAFLPGIGRMADPEPPKDRTSQKLALLFVVGIAIASIPFWATVLR